MKIGIDARFVGPEGTGLGKYTEKLIENLQKIDTNNNYVIFLREANWSYLKLTSKNFEKKLADIQWYSPQEQFKMPAIYNQANLDLLHVPHFNVPILYRKKFVVTIHDLIHHHFSQESTTTKNPVIFKFKRAGYKITISNAIKKSKKIIVPSNFVKNEIIGNFKITPEKIVVTYEAAEEEYFQAVNPDRTGAKRQTSTANRQLVYIGNAYPHKNLGTLLDAMKMLTANRQPTTVNLIIVSPRNVFSERLGAEIKDRNLMGKVKIMGYQNPKELVKILSHSAVYVFPSLAEGFGIPGLNAMAAGVPVICSNIPTLKEVYGDAAVYFNPNDPADIAKKIKSTVNQPPESRQKMAQKGRDQAKKYSWLKMARQTLAVYESA